MSREAVSESQNESGHDRDTTESCVVVAAKHLYSCLPALLRHYSHCNKVNVAQVSTPYK